MSDGAWAILNTTVAAFWILAIAANCYRIHRRFEQDRGRRY